MASVLGAQQTDDHGMAGLLDTIPVSPPGWTDLAEVRLVGQRWLPRQRNQQSA